MAPIATRTSVHFLRDGHAYAGLSVGAGSAGSPTVSAGGFPDATNTGTSGSLSSWSGGDTFSTPGQTITGQLIQLPGIGVTANNVTFNNCKIVYTGTLAADGVAAFFVANGVTGTTLTDCEIDGQSNIERAIKGYDEITVTRCRIHHAGNGVEVATQVTVVDSYLHDIVTTEGTTWHADGIQTGEGAVSDCLIRHNTILLPGGETGAINIIDNSHTFAYSNITVENNLLAGGSYCLYLDAGTLTNVAATGNHFSTRYFARVGQFGAWYNTTGFTVSGNVIDETGAPANDNSF